MHTTNYGHNGVPSVSRDAAIVHKQGSRLHTGILGVLATELRGAATHLGGHTRAQRTEHRTDTYNAGKIFIFMNYHPLLGAGNFQSD